MIIFLYNLELFKNPPYDYESSTAIPVPLYTVYTHILYTYTGKAARVIITVGQIF